MTTTETARRAAIEWGIRHPAGEYETCHDERTARILAEDYRVQVVSRVVVRTEWAEPTGATGVLETNACAGTYVLAIPTAAGGYRYEQCPGCVGCDYNTVAARGAQMTAEQAFARLPQVDDGDDW
jgi:hypothetical protein